MRRAALAAALLAACGGGAGDPDAESADVGPPDAGSPDAATADVGPAGGGIDAEAPDTGPPTDTGAPDAGGPPPACPDLAVLELDSSSRSTLDVGWTGLAHDLPLPTDNVLAFAVDCERDFAPCGTCRVRGPVDNPRKADNQRCERRPWLTCDDDTDCPSSPCVHFFGAPVPFGVPASGGACATSHVVGEVTGVLDVEAGSFGAPTLDLRTLIFLTSATQPCPVCEDDATPWDGVLAGTCRGGTRDGQPCDVSARSAEWGDTSFDCPPSRLTLLGTMRLSLGPIETTTVTWEIDEDSPSCEAGRRSCHVGTCEASGDACHVDTDCQEPGDRCASVPGARPDACLSECVTDPSAPDEGTCPDVVDRFCTGLSTVGCASDSDCAAVDAGTCTAAPRSCFGPRLVARGRASVPVDARARSRVATLFPVPLSVPILNSVVGLPGPGRMQMEVLVDYVTLD